MRVREGERECERKTRQNGQCGFWEKGERWRKGGNGENEGVKEREG